MNEVKYVDLKPADRMTQAGLAIVEEAGMAFFSEAYKFPEVTTGHMRTVDNQGTLKIDGPVNEFAKTSMIFKADDSTTQFGTWQHTEMIDASGHVLQKIDLVNMAKINPFNDLDLEPVMITGKMGTRTDFRGPDGAVQFSLQGKTIYDPRDYSPGGMSGNKLPDPGKPYTHDSRNTITDAAGNYVGDIALVAKPVGQGNVLDITAKFSSKGNYIGDVEALITVDPYDQRNADFQIRRKYDPPPPPKPAQPK
jgi:hypothetical protein